MRQRIWFGEFVVGPGEPPHHAVELGRRVVFVVSGDLPEQDEICTLLMGGGGPGLRG